MSSLKFHKMQGAGNDFVVLDNRELGLSMDEIISLTPRLCDRKFGIGADGLLMLELPQVEDVDFTMVYRNADGSDAGMCGNGARCLAMFAAHHGLQNLMKFNVHDSIYRAEVDKIEQLVTVYFPDVEAPNWIKVNDQKLIQVYPNTEHVVLITEQTLLDNEENLVTLGNTIRYSEKLNPPGCNVNFVSINPDASISLQTYERGVENLTLACGTGAIAAAIASHFISENESGEYSKEIHVKGGDLAVNFTFALESRTYHQVALKGPAEFVYEGIFPI